MKIEIDYPASTKIKEVRNINFILNENIVIVELYSTERERIEVDLVPIMKDFNEIIMKDFFTKIISVASGVAQKDIPNELFKTELSTLNE